MSSSILTYLQKFPTNAQISIQRLTPLAWIRLIVIVVLYLLIRPFLMRYVERAQTRSLDRVVNDHPAVPVRRRGEGQENGEEEEEGEMDGAEMEYAVAEATALEGYGGKARRRVARELDEDEEEEKDAEFLKRYCT